MLQEFEEKLENEVEILYRHGAESYIPGDKLKSYELVVLKVRDLLNSNQEFQRGVYRHYTTYDMSPPCYALLAIEYLIANSVQADQKAEYVAMREKLEDHLAKTEINGLSLSRLGEATSDPDRKLKYHGLAVQKWMEKLDPVDNDCLYHFSEALSSFGHLIANSEQAQKETYVAMCKRFSKSVTTLLEDIITDLERDPHHKEEYVAMRKKFAKQLDALGITRD